MPEKGMFFALDLDRNVIGPLYQQLYDGLQQMILDGRLAPGSRLPANRVLARNLKLSRNTVATALQQLLAEGYVVTRQGDGTYVAPELPEKSSEAGRAEGTASNAYTFRDDPARQYGLSRRGRDLAAVSRPPTGSVGAFSMGPDIGAFPFNVWSRLLGRTWRRPARELTVNQDTGGYPPLKTAIATYLGAMRSVRCEPDQIIVVGSAQQAISLASQVLLDHGDQVMVEEPGYGGIRGALTAAGLRVALAPVDDEGLDITAGEARAPLARMVCVAPSHQYPLGVVMSLGRRLALIEWARRRQAWILEDDYDSEYRYAGRPLASMQGLDTTGRVIYVGNYSKVLFPSLQLGYLVVPTNLVDPFLATLRVQDDQTAITAQPVLAEFIADGHFATHVWRMRRLYAARQEALLDMAKRELDGLFRIDPDEAGMHLIAWPGAGLPGTIDDGALAQEASDAGILTLPLSGSYAGRADRQGLMLGYAAHNEDAITVAAKSLARVIKTSPR